MRPHVRLSRSLLCSLLAPFAFATAAQATNLSLGQTRIRAVWSSFAFNESSAEVRCPVTLEGSFHSSTIMKSAGGLIGLVSRAALTRERCTGEGATLLAEALPWHIVYDTFEGVLPSITGVHLKLVGAAVLLRPFGMSCLYRTTTSSPFRAVASIGGGTVTGLRMDESATVPSAA